jgi:ribose transport system substrate-binding protein
MKRGPQTQGPDYTYFFHPPETTRMFTKRKLLALAAGLSMAGFASIASAQEIYIPLVSKGFQHQFWQAVKQGADQAAKDYKVKVTFEGPETEQQVDKQMDMLSAAIRC